MPAGDTAFTSDMTRAISFYLELDGIQEGQFKGVTGGEMSIEVVEYIASSKKGEYLKTKQPGKISFSNITLSRGMSAEMNLHKWIDDIAQGKIASSRKGGSVTGYDDSGEEVYKMTFERGWPIRYKGMDFDASTNEVKVEEVEICVEKCNRVK